MKEKAVYYSVTGILLTGQTSTFLLFIWSMYKTHMVGGWVYPVIDILSIASAFIFYALNRKYKRSYFTNIADIYELEIYDTLTRTQKRAFDRGTEKRQNKKGVYSGSKK